MKLYMIKEKGEVGRLVGIGTLDIVDQYIGHDKYEVLAMSEKMRSSILKAIQDVKTHNKEESHAKL